ncbi:MAG: hydrogenase maturation protease [Candidatus Hodarchaeales archaeon]
MNDGKSNEYVTTAAIFGIGNKYRKDDGIGLFILSRLQSKLAGLDYLFFNIEIDIFGIEDKLAQCKDVELCIFVDAAGSKTLEPGTIIVTSFDQSPLKGTDFTTTTHGVTVTDFLQLISRTKPDLLPMKVVIVAVVVPDIGFGEGLSPVAQKSIPAVIKVIDDILRGKCLPVLIKTDSDRGN